MLQAAKRAGAATLHLLSISPPSRTLWGVLVTAIATRRSKMALKLVSNSAADSVSNSVTRS